VLTACGPGAGTPTEPEGDKFSDEISGVVKAWGFENADEVGTSRLDHAEALLGESDVTIDIDASAFDAQKFTTLAASGNSPDVVQMNAQFVTTYASQGLILPLDECYSVQGVEPDSHYYPQVIDDVSYDGSVYGVPQFYQPPAIIENRRVMEEAGVTSEDLDTSNPERFLEAVEKMTVMDGANPTRVGFDPQGVSQAGLWMLSFGGEIIADDGQPALDNPQNAEAIEFLKAIYDLEGGFANAKSFIDSFDIFGDGNSFTTDTVGAAIFPQWYVNVLTPYVDDIEIGAVPVRTQDGNPFTVASGQAFVIPANAENPSAACAWAIALTSLDAWNAAGEARNETTINNPDRNGINAGLFTGSPEADQAIRDAYVVETGTGFDQTIATYYEVAANGQSFGSSPAGQQIQTELQNAVTAALLGEKSAADALADAQAAAQRAYDQVAG
jgi:multiple sugar transport system substrate-binding protein